MFTPLSISRSSIQNVCPSCLSIVYRRSNFSRSQRRSQNLSTAVDPIPLAQHGPARRIEAPNNSEPTLSSNRTVIEALKVALNNDGTPNKVKLVQNRPKRDANTVAKQTRSSGGIQTAQLKDKGGSTDSKSAQTSREKEEQISTTEKQIPAKEKQVSTRRKTLQLKEESPTMTDGSDQIDKKTDSPLEPGVDHTQRTKSYRDARNLRGRERQRKKSKAIRASEENENSSIPVAGSQAFLNEDMVAMLEKKELGPKERKLLMKQLRHSLTSRPIKLPKSRKQRVDKKKLVELSNKKKGSKLSQRSTDSNLRLTEKAGMTAYEIRTIDAAELNLVPIESPQPPVPNLAYGLERVLFNPGVYQLRDPRSRVYNFDPYLESIMPVADFDFNALKEYITSSRDETLLSAAAAENKKYTGSTSSMTSALAHFHFLLSQWRPVNISNLSKGFPETLRTFTQLQRAPSAVFLRWRNGTYAIDADKEFDTANILMMLGKSMEKLLTLPTKEFEKYRKENSNQISADERNEPESFHYTTMGDFLMRSQLDAYDPRVPGTGMFDLKTRAVVSIRMDARNYQDRLGYEIRSRHGEFQSYEREYYDMIRAAFLKYSLQVRMGRMDGIFVAFHNTERIFGFQYISLTEMDIALHGREDLTIGDSEFKLSLELLNRVLDRATAKFPEKSLRLFFETRDTKSPFMYIFAEPVTEEGIVKIQNSKKTEVEEYQRMVLGIGEKLRHEESLTVQAQGRGERRKLHAEVKDSTDNAELETPNDIGSPGQILEGSAMVESESSKRSSITEASKSLSARNDEVNATSNDLDAAENFPTEDAGISTPALQSDAGEIHEDVDVAVGNLKADTDTEAEAEVSCSADADHEDKYKHDGESKTGKGDVLAMMLSIRNKVNGVYVERPNNIGPDDRWTVEYSLAEFPTREQSQILYRKTQRRRSLIFEKDKKDVQKAFPKAYARKLATISQEGRSWREGQNHIDRVEPVKVLRSEIQESE